MNPVTKLLMIVLRIAIGWHLLYEGYGKVMSTLEDKKPFSAEMYLRNSTGPLRFYFRGLVDDYHGLGMLDSAAMKERWSGYVAETSKVHKLTAEQSEELQRLVEQNADAVASHVEGKKEEIARYKEAISSFEAKEQRPLPGFGEVEKGNLLRDPLPPFEWQAHKRAERDLDKTRKDLTGPVLQWTDEIVSLAKAMVQQNASASVSDDARLQASTKSRHVDKFEWKPNLHQINLTTMWGLSICGSLMILGLFTRTACLGAACLLGLFYFSMPPWPGLDPAPIAEGTYLIVNKNLIELIACLMLASSPVGVWGGVDSIIRGMLTRPVFGIGKREVISLDDA